MDKVMPITKALGVGRTCRSQVLGKLQKFKPANWRGLGGHDTRESSIFYFFCLFRPLKFRLRKEKRLLGRASSPSEVRLC